MVAPCRDDSSACSTFHCRMTSWLRGTSIAFFDSAQLAAAASIGRAGGTRGGLINTVHPAHLDLFRRRLRRDVVVQRARFRLLDVLIDHDADDDILVAALTAAD